MERIKNLIQKIVTDKIDTDGDLVDAMTLALFVLVTGMLLASHFRLYIVTWVLFVMFCKTVIGYRFEMVSRLNSNPRRRKTD